MKMNLPNKLTILRTVMIPFFILFLYTDWFHGYDKIIAAVIFIAASLTDMLDGKIARKYNLVTNFGKFMDPLADKLLVCSALIALVDLNKIAAWIVIIIIAREFIISGFRLVASDNGVVIAASYWGKFKTIPDAYDYLSCGRFAVCLCKCCRHGAGLCGTGADGDFTGRLYCKEL